MKIRNASLWITNVRASRHASVEYRLKLWYFEGDQDPGEGDINSDGDLRRVCCTRPPSRNLGMVK